MSFAGERNGGIVRGIMPGLEKPKLTKSQFADALARLDQVLEEAARLRREITTQMAVQRAREPQTMRLPRRRIRT
jgi:hypothetical protein